MNEHKKQSWKPYIDLIRKSRIPWLLLIGYFILSLIYSKISTDLIPYSSKIYTGQIFDKAVIEKFILMVVLLILIWIAQSICQYWASFKTEKQLQLSIWKKMIRMPMRDMDKQNASTLPSRITSDPTTMSQQFLLLFSVITSVYTIWITVGNIRKDSPVLASLILKMLLVLVIWTIVVNVLFGRLKYKSSHKFQETYARFTNYVTERLSSYVLIKSSATEDKELENAIKVIDQQYKAGIYKVNVEYICNLVANSSMYLFQALVLIVDANMIKAATLDTAGMLTAYRYSMLLPAYIITFNTLYFAIKNGHGGSEKICQIMASESESFKREHSFTMDDNDINIKNVSFSYGDKPTLNNVSFTIPNNKITAIVGPNGSGKSTVIKLLDRYYTPDDGEITFGKIPVESIHLNEWRKSIGYISQNTILISGTVRDNLTYALNREVDDAEIVQALKAANAYDFVSKLPDGIDTDLGEMGANLSSGERQRIGIARVVLRDPEYLVLDEATSNLDSENKTAVLNALRNMMKNRTSIVIAHDMDIIDKADNIVVLNKGRVDAVGTHDYLCKNSELYAMYEKTSRLN